MATDLHEKEGTTKEENPSQADYSDKFNTIAGAEKANDGKQAGFDNKFGDIVNNLKKEEASPSGNPASPAMDGLYKAGQNATGYGAAKKVAGFVGGGVVTVIAIVAMVFLFQSFQAKIFAHFLDKFYGAATQHMIKHRGMVFLSKWIQIDLLPAAKACGNTIDWTCVNQNRGAPQKGIFGRFVAAHRNKKFHDLMIQEGMYFSYEGGSYTLTTNLGKSDPVSEGDATSKRIDQVFNSKYDVFDRVFSALEEHGTMDRRSKRLASKVLREQYGARMCLLYCNIKKALEQRQVKLADRIDNFRNAIIGAIGARIIDSGVARQVILLDCLTQKVDCSKPQDVKERLEEINTEDAHRLKNTPAAFDRLMERGKRFKDKKRGLITQGNTLAEIAFERMLEKVIGPEAAQQVTRFAVRAIPYIGWVIAAVEIAVLIHDFLAIIRDSYGDHTLRNIWAEMKIAQSVHAFQLVSASGDEAEGVGSAIGGGYDLAATAAMSERLQGIEQSKFYQYNFGSLKNKKDYEKGRPDTGELCMAPLQDETTEIPKHEESFCEEMKLDTDPWIVKLFSDETLDENLPAWAAFILKFGTGLLQFQLALVKQTLGAILGAINDALDWVTKVLFIDSGLAAAAMAAIRAIPFVAQIIDEITAIAKKFMLGIFNYGLPLPFRDEDGVFGARLASAAAIGADFTYNYELGKGGKQRDGEETPYGLGGGYLTPAQSEKLYEQVAQEERERFRNLSFKERFFSTDEPTSLLSRLVMANPTQPLTNPTSLIAAIANPAQNLFGFMADRIISGSAYAVPVKRVGMASTGTPQYGFATDHPMMSTPPSETEDNACKDTRVPAPAPTPGNLEGTAQDPIGRDLFLQTQAQQCMLDKTTVNVWSAPYTDEPIE